MPCYDGRENESRLVNERALNFLTNALCFLLTEFEDVGEYLRAPIKTREWFEIHREIDKLKDEYPHSFSISEDYEILNEKLSKFYLENGIVKEN